MKRWSELTDEQRDNVVRGLSYLLGDQFYIDMIVDHPCIVDEDLRTYGYDPGTMSAVEKLHALKHIDTLPENEAQS